MARKRKKKALGRGLDALIPDLGPIDSGGEDFFECAVERIRPNRYQPRIEFSDTDLEELSTSIRDRGILQPLLVRKDGDGYELVAGERRLRAARMAGLETVPVVVRELDDTELLELSIIENIQREDLNPIEEAEAYHRLMHEFDLTQEKVAERVGKSRPAVANLLRLRSLPDPIRKSIMTGELSTGHGRALLGVESSSRQLSAWRAVTTRGLSVRETEALVNRMKTKPPRKTGRKRSADVYYTDLSERLSRHFGTRVQIRGKGKKGKLEIEFYSEEDLDRLIGMFDLS